MISEMMVVKIVVDIFPLLFCLSSGKQGKEAVVVVLVVAVDIFMKVRIVIVIVMLNGSDDVVG